MTDKKKPAKRKKATKKKPDPANAVPLEGSDEKPEEAVSAAPKTEKNQSASKPDPEPEAAKEPDNGKEETVAPLSKCKVYGQPDVHHKKCRLCKDLESCLAIELKKKATKANRKKTEPKGKSFIGFQKRSQKAAFATHIAKQPQHMRDIKSAPWNKKELTWYDTFNELRRNTTEEGEPLPLAAKNKEGVMCILEKNLNKQQREQMKEEVKKFPY